MSFNSMWKFVYAVSLRKDIYIHPIKTISLILVLCFRGQVFFFRGRHDVVIWLK